MTGLDLKFRSRRTRGARPDAGDDQATGCRTVDAVARQLIRRVRIAPPDSVGRAARWRMARSTPNRHTRRAVLARSCHAQGGREPCLRLFGSPPLSAAPINCQYWATVGAALSAVFPLLAWDMTWNEGIVRCIEVIAPEGSLLNATKPAPISLNTTATVAPINILSNAVLSKMLAASPKYSDRAVGRWGSSSSSESPAASTWTETTSPSSAPTASVCRRAPDLHGRRKLRRSYHQRGTEDGQPRVVGTGVPQAVPLPRRILADSGGAGSSAVGSSRVCDHAAPHLGRDDGGCLARYR